MEYRRLGAAGLSVSEICLGTMQFRWTTNEANSYRVLDAYFEAGGNFIDTADCYSFWAKGLKGGEAETIIGKWMQRKRNRRNIVLATKCGVRMWPGAAGEGLSRAHIVKACDDSLRRLKTDSIDLYQSHWPDMKTPIEETLAAYRDLIQAGKIHHAGCSNFSSGLLAEALVLASEGDLARYVSIQPRYNLLDRQFEKDHVWLVEKYDVAVIPYSPLAGGFLTGKYRRDQAQPRSLRAGGLKRYMNDSGWKLIEKLESLGRRRGKTVLQMSLGWLLSHEWMTAPIVGANTPEQLQESLGASGLKLSAEELAEIEKAAQ